MQLSSVISSLRRKSEVGGESREVLREAEPCGPGGVVAGGRGGGGGGGVGRGVGRRWSGSVSCGKKCKRILFFIFFKKMLLILPGGR